VIFTRTVVPRHVQVAGARSKLVETVRHRAESSRQDGVAEASEIAIVAAPERRSAGIGRIACHRFRPPDRGMSP
jgi:hypothetical protein